MADAKYAMTLSLGIIDHLGLNLYSNIPAVLSETVANAWDAEATEVDIEIDTNQQIITIVDNGHGMDTGDVNSKFLTVGYRRREEGTSVTPRLNRHVMGRKGIGKLSLFAIADSITVHTVKTDLDTGEQLSSPDGFVLRTPDIRDEMKRAGGAGTYQPDALDPPSINLEKGTRLELSALKVKATAATGKHLRRRLARRFSIIGVEHDFTVRVDGQPITVADRDFFYKIQYLWTVGDDDEDYESQAKNAKKTTHLSGVVDPNRGYEVSGWLGTVASHDSIDEGNNTVVILAWGKLIQEDVLNAIKAGGLYTKYLIGELRADFLDLDEEEDIVTSDRQSLKENDQRYTQLLAFVREHLLRPVENSWRDWRRDEGAKDALTNPAIEEWYKTLSTDNRKYAKRLFGKIYQLPMDSEIDRLQLYRNAILAFEKLALQQRLSQIDELPDDADFTILQTLFDGVDELEAAEYHEIARGRLQVIKRFNDIVETEREKVIQRHLFDHLWLLDPSWERASTNARIEEAVTKEFNELDKKLTDEQRKGRVDIRYRTAAGKHIIIELKKYDASVDLFDLSKQIEKYRSALETCLREQFQQPHPAIEVIVVHGRPLSGVDDHNRRDALLRDLNARAITYDVLIQQALESYRDYLQANQKISRISALLERIGSGDEEQTTFEQGADEGA